MYFDNFYSLIHMDGHGLYVWAAYGIGLLVILYNIVAPIMKYRKVISAIHRHHLRNNNATNYNEPAGNEYTTRKNRHWL